MAKKKKTTPVKQGLLFSIAAAAGHVAGKINAAGGQLTGMAGEVLEAVKYKVNEIKKKKKTLAKKAGAKTAGKTAKKKAVPAKHKAAKKAIKRPSDKTKKEHK